MPNRKKYSVGNLILLEKLFIVRTIILVVLMALLAILSSNGSIITASSNLGVYTNEDSPYGKPYREWIANWWEWWLGIPNSVHLTDNYSDSKRCSVMQNGSVWFLPDILVDVGKINYTCNVPSGKAILLPLTTSICERGGEGPLTDSQLIECADNIVTPVENIDVRVDGNRVDISKSFDKTNFFNVTFPQDPVRFWGDIIPGSYRGTATGYFLFLHDLPLGEHNIELKVVDLLRGKPAPENLREGSFKLFVQ
jgi:hypothetical protein